MMRGLLFGCAIVVAAGCNDPTYFDDCRSLRVGDVPDGGGALQPDTDVVRIPYRNPNTDERHALTVRHDSLGLPADKPLPWVSIDDLPIEVEYVIHNLDDQPAQAFFSAVGCSDPDPGMAGGCATTGCCYDPGAFVDPLAVQEDQQPPPPMMGKAPIDLAPFEIRQGVFREDDFVESAKDLEAIARFPLTAPPDPATAFKVLNNRSDVSRDGMQMVPANDVYPQLAVITLHLAADAHVEVSYQVRVRDLNNKLLPDMTHLLSPAAGMTGDGGAASSCPMPAQ